MIRSRKNPKKMFTELRNKNLELHAYAEGSENLRKRALGALTYNVKKKNFYKKHTLEPVEIIQEVPVEVIKEVEVVKEVEVKVPYEVVKEVPVEVPVEIIKEVEVEVPVEVIKEVEVEVEVIKKVFVEVEQEVIKEVEVIMEVPTMDVEAEKVYKDEIDKLKDSIATQEWKKNEEIEELSENYMTKLKLFELSKKAMEKRYETALVQTRLKWSGWEGSKNYKRLATYAYILTPLVLTQILQWIIL